MTSLSFKCCFQQWLNPLCNSKKSSFNIVVDSKFVSKKLFKELVSYVKIANQNQHGKLQYKQSTKNDLNNNQTFKNSVQQFSLFLITSAYNHSNSRLFKIKNIIAFFSIAQVLIYSQIFSQEFKSIINRQIVNLIFNQPMHAYKQIYSKSEESKFLKQFTHSLQNLVQKRILMFIKIFGLSTNLVQLLVGYVKFFLQKQNLGQSNKAGNHNEQYSIGQKILNQISIDMILLSSVYLMYKRKQKRVRLCSMLKIYHQKIANRKIMFTSLKLLQFYNTFMIKYYSQKRLQNISRINIQIDQKLCDLITSDSIQNQSSVLDNYMSSLEN